MHTILAFFVGVGLSATSGFRVFVPLLGLSIANRAGLVPLAQGFEWIGSWPAIIAFGSATIIEIAAYYVPWLDNLLDTIAVPVAVAAGTVITASVLVGLPPFLRWTLGVIAGGGVAGVVQGSSALLRGVSTATTGGAGNPLVSTGELIASVVGTIISIVMPIVAILLVGLILFFIVRRMVRHSKRTA